MDLYNIYYGCSGGRCYVMCPAFPGPWPALVAIDWPASADGPPHAATFWGAPVVLPLVVARVLLLLL